MVRRNRNQTTKILTGVASSALNTWNAAMTQMKGSMDRQTFSTLLGSAELLACEDGVYTVGMANGFTCGWAEQRLSGTIEKILSGMDGAPRKVAFVVSGAWLPPDRESRESGDETVLPAVPAEVKAESGTEKSRPCVSNILARFTFDNFVVSNNNNLASAAARAVSETPGTAYNPLFIYGGVGMGKTHLLHAIGNRLKDSDLRVVFASSEEFTSDFIRSIQNRDDETFREKYRSADVLLIDDIQFIIGKESTQEAFFHTFNKLYEMNKQIVITSDRSPRSMAALDERMRSRFEWGLIADIQKPDFDTRVAILRKKADLDGISVDDDILEMIADRIDSNIRELEGSLIRVSAYAKLNQCSIDKDVVSSALKDISIVRDPKRINAEMIIESVADYFKLDSDLIRGESRKKEIARARHVAVYLTREMTSMSLPRIGDEFGRDHSTILNSCDKVSKMLEQESEMKETIANLKRIISEK